MIFYGNYWFVAKNDKVFRQIHIKTDGPKTSYDVVWEKNLSNHGRQPYISARHPWS